MSKQKIGIYMALKVHLRCARNFTMRGKCLLSEKNFYCAREVFAAREIFFLREKNGLLRKKNFLLREK